MLLLQTKARFLLELFLWFPDLFRLHAGEHEGHELQWSNVGVP